MPIISTKGAASSQGVGEFNYKKAASAYIEDVFSTYLYTGNGSTQTITNGIDLSGKGGLVWFKYRAGPNGPAYHQLYNTARGVQKTLATNTTGAEATELTGLTAFNANGFSFGSDGNINASSDDTYASWTFRKAEKFFDVVTWTGNNASERAISHNLGSVPGCIIVKAYTGSFANLIPWIVYHRSLPKTGGYPDRLELNSTAASAPSTTVWGSTAFTSTNFYIGSDDVINNSNKTYIAYVFAHDAGGFGANGTDNVITCGSFTTDGSGVATVSLGYEPQWVLLKFNSNDNWKVFDNMRGMSQTNWNELYPNSSSAEVARTNQSDLNIRPSATGFTITWSPQASRDCIYIAIRRGPMKTPTAGTEVFSPNISTSAEGTVITTGFPIDSQLMSSRSSSGHYFADRLRGISTVNSSPYVTRLLATNSTTNESNANQFTRGWNNTSFQTSIEYASISAVYWNFRRAPGFFDIVCYTGDGTIGRQITHNLTVKPELLIVKARSAATYPQWWVWSPINTTTFNRLQLESTAAATNSSYSSSNVFPGEPTSTYFVIGGSGDRILNQNTETFVAYLFASVAGVSKVGSYTGSGTTKQIDCGFTGGARFVLIKRTDSTGDWYVWDSARGIVAGNDPYLLLNSTAAEVTNTDYVDTYSAGFEISSTAPAAINANGGTFIFLAIA